MSTGVHLSRLTPLSFLDRSATAFPNRVAVVDGDRRLTWSEFRDRARRLAVSLQRGGVERGDRVAFLAPNTVELLEAHYGVPAAGAVLVAINTRLTPDEIAYILGHCGARRARGRPHAPHLVDGLALDRVIVCGDGGDYKHTSAPAGDGEPEDRIESEDDTISINYTSGTTGRPKGVDVHLPGRVPERARRGGPLAPGFALGVPVDAADVPLQRLVLHLGGHGRSGRRTSACARSTRRWSGG